MVLYTWRGTTHSHTASWAPPQHATRQAPWPWPRDPRGSALLPSLCITAAAPFAPFGGKRLHVSVPRPSRPKRPTLPVTRPSQMQPTSPNDCAPIRLVRSSRAARLPSLPRRSAQAPPQRPTLASTPPLPTGPPAAPETRRALRLAGPSPCTRCSSRRRTPPPGRAPRQERWPAAKPKQGLRRRRRPGMAIFLPPSSPNTCSTFLASHVYRPPSTASGAAAPVTWRYTGCHP